MNPINELPLGFGMALAQNEPAMEAFSPLSRSHQQSTLNQASHVHSKQEMRQLVNSITHTPFGTTK